MTAYDVALPGLDGPPWIMDNYTCFDIVAKLPPGTDREQFRRMLQNLLVERFHLSIHHETRMLPSSALVVAKGGPKLKPAVKNAASAESPASRPAELPWTVSMKDARLFRLTARRMNMKALATFIESALHAPVTDETGLAGDYEFTLDFLPPGAPSADPANSSLPDPGDDLASALQSQLGLKLNTRKLPRDVIVVDHVDQVPADN